MAQDYKSRANSKKKQGKPASPLVPFLIGVMVGIFLTALAWLKLGPTFPGVESAIAVKPQPTTQSEKNVSEPSQRYDFYTILPEMEVLIPDEEIRQPESTKKRTSNRPSSPISNGSYMLQMGSFRRIKDAERRKAELAIIGIEASIQPVNSGTREALYRVRSGPYSSRQQIAKLRSLARQNNIDSLPIKLRK
ncbi:MAG: SPOR domain-containing protein [Candidatus Polarisedimenticolaceae bacterium]|nr:SPOR domain-containing protein [Candidatus Polarisedimenticolaceae bacterium]